MSMRRFIAFDRQDNPLFDLDGRLEYATRTEKLNGEHKLDIVTTQTLEEGVRLLVQDGTEKWREWVIDEPDENHDGSAEVLRSYGCTWSMQYDLATCYGGELWPGTYSPISAGSALHTVLNTQDRWEVGNVTVSTTGGTSLYDGTVWDYIGKLIETWGGEIEPRIEVDSNGVVHRYVDWLAHVGQTDATRRFDYGEDCTNIRRKPAPGPRYCRVIPRGGKDATDDDGVSYSERVGVEEEPYQADSTGEIVHPEHATYIEDTAATDNFKQPDGNGGWHYPSAIVLYDSDDPEELLSLAMAEVEKYTRPAATYEASLLQFAAAGMDAHGVQLGDEVQIVDRAFGEAPLRLEARIVEMTVNELDDSDIEIVVGDSIKGIETSFKSIRAEIDTVTARVNTIDSDSTVIHLNNLIASLNSEINATGGYWYAVPGLGTRTYDVAVSDPAVGDEASQVVEIRGGAIRIANSRTSDGDWDWKSVFVSGHVAAELVTAAAITTGYIGSNGGTYIDLDSNTIQLGSDSMLHAKLDNNAFELWTPQGTYDSRSALHLGYGLVKSNQDVYVSGPYFTLGERDSSADIGFYSYSEGEQHKVTGAYSHAEGYGHTISESYAHAEGSVNTVSGRFAHAEGSLNTASGNFSHVGGNGCTASGGCSFSMGVDAVAGYDYSTAFGRNTRAQNTCQFVCGQYNTYDSGPFVVGWGGPYTSVGSRKNILTLAQDGGLWIAGSLTQNSDRRLKEHHAYLGDDACEFVRSLKPALFTKDGERHVGFYAQDVQNAEPDGWDTNTVKAKHTDESLDFDPLTLDYTALIAPLVTYAQSLEKKIETQQEQIDALTQRIEALEARA